MWPFISETRQQVEKKEKRAKVCNNFDFFRKKIISKVMKDNNYKIKYLNRVIYSCKGSHSDLQLSRICLASTERM